MLKLGSRGTALGRRVRCPACRYPNLGIDIWCERCGTPLDWQRGAAGAAPDAPAVPLNVPPRPLPELKAPAAATALTEVVAPEPPDPPAAPATASQMFCPS